MAYLQGQPPEHKAIAYCHYSMHKGYLSERLLKLHGCLGKKCPYLEIYSEKQFWKDRKRKKSDKKLREYIKKGNIEGIGEHIARIIYESSTQEMGDTDIREQNDNLE